MIAELDSGELFAVRAFGSLKDDYMRRMHQSERLSRQRGGRPNRT